jgi:nucleotide-binding universal stress UspA family protein
MVRSTKARNEGEMLRSILVPLDGSAFSEAALSVAEALARPSQASLHLVRIHVRPTRPPLSLEGMPVTDPDRDAARWESERAYVSRIRRRLGPRSELASRIAVLDGPVGESLATYAAANRIDLIVMATHARRGLARTWMGSVADEVLRQSRVPVLLVRGAEAGAPAAAYRGRPRILIALDGSAIAERVVEPAVSLGRVLDADYRLLRVVNPIGPLGDLPAMFTPRLGMAMAAEHEMEAKAYLNQIVWWMQERGLEATARVQVSERPAAAILAEAEREGTAFVAMGTHGRSGVSRLLMGSVAGQVLHGTKVPLLLYRPPLGTPRPMHRPAPMAAGL